MAALVFVSRKIILSSIFLFINLFMQIHHHISADPFIPNFQYCDNGIGNYTKNSNFQSNLNTIISSISSKINSFGFYNNSAGDGADQVNAVAFCRGDMDIEVCRACLNDAARNLTQLCPNQMEAIRCRELHSFAGDLAAQASNGGTFRKYAGLKTTDPNGQTIFGLMQCSPDISPNDCMSCLQTCANFLSPTYSRVGAQLLTPSCTFRYEMYSFLRTLTNQPSTGKKSKSKAAIIVVCIVIIVLVLAVSFCVFITRRRRRKANTDEEEIEDNDDFDGITQYNFSLIRDATEGFSTANMLGRGGFGEVYKGVLFEGKEIAVKRLSTTSGQGETEFRNEVKLLAKLQHKCLVKLLGFSSSQKERLLIYEFMPNGSLDNFLFDPKNRSRLDWDERFIIIKSIAKGLLYLHEDSRLMIIHRDLKASNILLDKEMNAKIADFGMARLFVLDEDEGVTKRIAGTFGYMAPEYAMHGLFSVKSDVYSYGVLLLEILSGKKNSSSLMDDSFKDLPSHAYKTWKEGKELDLIDPMTTIDSDSMENMSRCIHIALLCVQENVGSRPTMAAVVLMLQSLTLTLPAPSEPGFFSNAEMIVPQWSSFFDFTESSSSSSQSKPILPNVGGRSDRALNVESYSRKHLR